MGHLTRILVSGGLGVSALLATGCASTPGADGTQPKAVAPTGQAASSETGAVVGIPWPINPPPQPSHGAGTANVLFTNHGSDPVTFTAGTKNHRDCPSNNWWYGGNFFESLATDPLDAGAGGSMVMGTNICGSQAGTLMPASGDGVFAVGIEGWAAFEFATDWTMAGNFEYFHWEGGYTGGGDTGGLVMYNCGNGQVLGSGKGSATVSFDYADGTTVCFRID